LGLHWVGAAAQTPPAQDKDPGAFGPLAEIFALPGAPSIKGKPWVAVDTGPANAKRDLEGWLIEDGPKDLVLFDWYGETHRLRKPGPDEKRPRIKEEKDGGIPWSAFVEADRSVAWKVRAEDYNAKSKKFLADGLPRYTGGTGAFGFVNQRFGLAHHVVDLARYAHFAHQLGQEQHAADLYAHAVEAYKKYAESYLHGSERRAPLHVFVTDRMASEYLNAAVASGHRGAPRKELLARWERVAPIPYHQYRDEARAMVKHYRNLLDEDARWVEPDAAALAKLSTERRVAYWLYHLRDLDVGQWTDPGMCCVFSPGFGFDLGNREKKKPNARRGHASGGRVALRKADDAAGVAEVAALRDDGPSPGQYRSGNHPRTSG
jgi:hypothetical protein